MDNGKSLFCRFNIGAAVRAGGGNSFNVPGSPKWDALFVQSYAVGDGSYEAVGDEYHRAEFIDPKA